MLVYKLRNNIIPQTTTKPVMHVHIYKTCTNINRSPRNQRVGLPEEKEETSVYFRSAKL
jgi:hypothetical protein